MYIKIFSVSPESLIRNISAIVNSALYLLNIMCMFFLILKGSCTKLVAKTHDKILYPKNKRCNEKKKIPYIKRL